MIGLLFASGASSSPSSSHGNHATKWHLVTRLLGLPRDETRNELKTCYWRVWIRICDLLGLGALNPDESLNTMQTSCPKCGAVQELPAFTLGPGEFRCAFCGAP
jgi:hypothetical protein